MKRFLSTALCLALALSLHAQGTDALPFTCIDRNPITSALAGAGSASDANLAYSAFDNASVIPLSEKVLDASASYQLWAPGTAKSNHFNAGVSLKLGRHFGISGGFALQRYGLMPVLDSDGNKVSSFNPNDQLFALGIGYAFMDNLSIGVNARYASELAGPENRYKGFSGDVFLTWEVFKGFRVSAGVASLGNKVKSSDGVLYAQPAHCKADVDWVMEFSFYHKVELAADAEYYFSNNYAIAAGVQYGYNGTVFVRGGYRFASPGCVIPSHLAIGLGAQFAGFRIDVSYLTASKALNNTITAGLGFSF